MLINNYIQLGYSPVCLNEWKIGICGKPRIKCADCTQKVYAVLDEKVIEDHLRGSIIIGLYPMLVDETCFFLAIDFDDEGWQKDITVPLARVYKGYIRDSSFICEILGRFNVTVLMNVE